MLMIGSVRINVNLRIFNPNKNNLHLLIQWLYIKLFIIQIFAICEQRYIIFFFSNEGSFIQRQILALRERYKKKVSMTWLHQNSHLFFFLLKDYPRDRIK